MKACTHCKIQKPLLDFPAYKPAKDGRASWCRACTKKAQLKWKERNRAKVREGNRAYYARHKPAMQKRGIDMYYRDYGKATARNATRYAIIKGKLKKGPCCFCGSTTNIDAHHEDYSKPLDVVWVCELHHAQLHAGKIRLTKEQVK